jgi:hypothetical protein
MLLGLQDTKVTATSLADPSKSATLLLRVHPLVIVTINPAAATLYSSQRMRFTAALSGTSDTRVRWALSGPGILLGDGTYQAPASISRRETAAITATSISEPDKSATASVELNPVTVSMNPASVEMYPSQKMRFSAAVNGTTNNAARWSLSGPGGLSPEGLYTAPSSVPNDQVASITATSVADPSQSATAVVNLKHYSVVDPSQSATAVVNLKHYNLARTGALTWVGILEKNATVTIDDAGASRGLLQGVMFPGVPILIVLDNSKEFSVVDAPGPSNGWKRVTIRSNRGHGTKLRIAWSVVSGGGMP